MFYSPSTAQSAPPRGFAAPPVKLTDPHGMVSPRSVAFAPWDILTPCLGVSLKPWGGPGAHFLLEHTPTYVMSFLEPFEVVQHARLSLTGQTALFRLTEVPQNEGPRVTAVTAVRDIRFQRTQWADGRADGHRLSDLRGPRMGYPTGIV